MSKHWFFDLDGTLARTGEDIVAAWKGAILSLGLECSRFDEVFSIGPPLEKVVYDLFPDKACPALVADLLERFKPLYDESGFPNTVPYPGVPEMLAELKDRGERIYIVTNKRHSPTRGIAAKFGWDSLFDGIWSYDTLGERYKKPDLLAKLLDMLGADPAQSAMVGDTAGDVEAGKANKMFAIGVSWGYGSMEELAGADAVCDSPSDIAKFSAK